MSALFAYPGQGAQCPGMLTALPDELPVRACLEQAADCLGQAPAELESAEALRGTRAVQLCLLIAGVAASGIQPAQRCSRARPRTPMATRAGSAGARRTTTGQPAFRAAQTQAGAFSGKCAGAMPRSRS